MADSSGSSKTALLTYDLPLCRERHALIGVLAKIILYLLNLVLMQADSEMLSLRTFSAQSQMLFNVS
jgi:hypothetical protein